MLYYNLLQLAHTSLIVLAAFFFIWSAYLLKDDAAYLLLSPIHIIVMMFYFNVFLINFNFDSDVRSKLSRLVNMISIFLAGSLFVYGDVVYYMVSTDHYQSQHSAEVYIGYIIIDTINMVVLLVLHYYNYTSRFLKTNKDVSLLLGFQFIYILNLMSQVIPLYTERTIPLTNDFAFMFWMIFILEEKWRRSVVDNSVVVNRNNSVISWGNNKVDEETALINSTIRPKKGQTRIVIRSLLLVCFYITASVSMYLYVVINMLDRHEHTLMLIWDYFLLTANSAFYLWTYTTFSKSES